MIQSLGNLVISDAGLNELYTFLHIVVYDFKNSVEHNSHIIAEADLLIELGPEGGDSDGRIVAQGTPDAVIKSKSNTGAFL